MRHDSGESSSVPMKVYRLADVATADVVSCSAERVHGELPILLAALRRLMAVLTVMAGRLGKRFVHLGPSEVDCHGTPWAGPSEHRDAVTGAPTVRAPSGRQPPCRLPMIRGGPVATARIR